MISFNFHKDELNNVIVPNYRASYWNDLCSCLQYMSRVSSSPSEYLFTFSGIWLALLQASFLDTFWLCSEDCGHKVGVHTAGRRLPLCFVSLMWLCPSSNPEVAPRQLGRKYIKVKNAAVKWKYVYHNISDCKRTETCRFTQIGELFRWLICL